MEKEKFRAVMKHFYLKKSTAAHIKAKLDEVHDRFIGWEGDGHFFLGCLRNHPY